MTVSTVKNIRPATTFLVVPTDVLAKKEFMAMITQTSNRIVARFLGANADGAFDIADKNFPVANLACSRRLHDGFNGLLDHGVGEDDFNFNFRKEIDRILAAAVDFSVALLAAESLDFGDGQTLRAHCGQRLFDLLELERFDDGVNFLHGL